MTRRGQGRCAEQFARAAARVNRAEMSTGAVSPISTAACAGCGPGAVSDPYPVGSNYRDCARKSTPSSIPARISIIYALAYQLHYQKHVTKSSLGLGKEEECDAPNPMQRLERDIGSRQPGTRSREAHVADRGIECGPGTAGTRDECRTVRLLNHAHSG
jgi:hypothetical protein